LRQATSLVNTIVHSSDLDTPVKRYIEQLGAVLGSTTFENAVLIDGDRRDSGAITGT
jgi:hypothetical protein